MYVNVSLRLPVTSFRNFLEDNMKSCILKEVIEFLIFREETDKLVCFRDVVFIGEVRAKAIYIDRPSEVF